MDALRGSADDIALTTHSGRQDGGMAVAVLAALALTGAGSARIGGGNARRAVLRIVIGGAVGHAVTYGIGHLFGGAIA